MLLGLYEALASHVRFGSKVDIGLLPFDVGGPWLRQETAKSISHPNILRVVPTIVPVCWSFFGPLLFMEFLKSLPLIALLVDVN
jgi:hypothetical protein